MFAGDSFLILATLIWVTIVVGPWYIGLGILIVSGVINYIHIRVFIILLNHRNRQLNLSCQDRCNHPI